MEELKKAVKQFAKERDWEKYHSPKNLVMGLSVEVGELMELFLWLSDEESKNLGQTKLNHLKEEIGDVMVYLVNLADKFGLDPIECAMAKLEINEKKYPSHLVKGSAKKYNEYSQS
ncbi:MAG: nucleotide pyrophosphohydrolase [Candidatus Tectomicrobia bacterium]|uniref:Nucleotide pyrophosphohydrolase n=1 Tax=Tectimicrobiota bacterium TaxID=2528274 RepID=A0A932G2A0_UNCTE|nr:nucleotide pyrophosphohydrolase [Candidatus Tectomicrobia bacterium]